MTGIGTEKLKLAAWGGVGVAWGTRVRERMLFTPGLQGAGDRIGLLVG